MPDESTITHVRSGLSDLSLLDLIPTLTPHHRPPLHLADWCALIERASVEPVRGLCSIPIRHFKTETTVHGIIWLLLRHPTWRIIFLTHSHEAAEKWGKRIRQIAEATGIGPERGWNKIAEWRNSAGGGVVVMSADQSKIGYDCDALVVDDALDEHDAEIQAKRDAADEAIALYTARCMKEGRRGPVLIVASRFHPDDPTGRRLTRTAVEWEYIHHAAIETHCNSCDKLQQLGAAVCQACGGATSDRAFAPDVWPLDELRKTRAELAERDPFEKIWWGQYMNDPKPIGSDLFREPTFYSSLPEWNFRRGFGLDMAYTIGDGGDWFARVAGRVYGMKLYLLDVTRHKIHPHMIESTCKRDMVTFGSGPFFSYMSGPEVGIADMLIERGVPIHYMPARYNKLVRAQRTIRRWNDGDILVPEETQAPWVRAFVHRLGCFRGRETDRDDDEADALVSLCDGIMGGVAAEARPKTLGAAYPGMLGTNVREPKDRLAF